MKIAFIGKFIRLNDEEYIARSFEMLGHEVRRIPQDKQAFDINEMLIAFKPNIILFCKWKTPKQTVPVILQMQRAGTKTVCWLFDLYFNYGREYLVRNMSYFHADYVFTTDGGHQKQFLNMGIKHMCVRQGIYKPECVLLPFKKIKYPLVFVGSENPIYPERTRLIEKLKAEWFGRKDTNEIRGIELNDLYSKTGIVIGDSFYSPHYWSNRIVETLGRGGFLIHQDVPGLKEEYPHIITYERGNIDDLRSKISYYLEHEQERREIIKKNFDWVLNNYTCEKQCKKLLNLLT